MSSYGIFRIAKLKKISNLKGSLMHAFREQETFNADPNRLKENVLLTPDAKNVESTLAKYDRLKPAGKIRADVVSAIEVLVTASPEKMCEMTKEQREDYLRKSLAFCNGEFGEENLLHAQIHNDETTAHLTAFYIPVIEKTNKKGITSRKLNASELLGNRKNFSDRQTRFYERVSKHYGLERGEIGSKAKHKRVLDWYSELDLDARTANDLMKDLDRKAFKAVKVEVEKPVKNFMGVYTSTEKVVETHKLEEPRINLSDVKMILSPYTNGNAKMKRREKAKLKHEAKRELEAEFHDKMKMAERAKEQAESALQQSVFRAYDFHSNLALKLNVVDEIDLQIGNINLDELESDVLAKVDNLTKAAESNEALEKFKKNVDDEVNNWTYSSTGKKAYANFDEYKKAFSDQNKRNDYLKEENKKLKVEVETLSEQKKEFNVLSGLKSRILGLVEGVREIVGFRVGSGLEDMIKTLVEFVRDVSKPDRIKEMYDEQCKKKIDDNLDFLIRNFEFASDDRNSWNERVRAFNAAIPTFNSIIEYTKGVIPENLKNVYGRAYKAMERDKHLASVQRMRMR